MGIHVGKPFFEKHPSGHSRITREEVEKGVEKKAEKRAKKMAELKIADLTLEDASYVKDTFYLEDVPFLKSSQFALEDMSFSWSRDLYQRACEWSRDSLSQSRPKLNFYGRFRPEAASTEPINKDNYLDALMVSAAEFEKENSRETYLNFLSDVVDRKLLAHGSEVVQGKKKLRLSDAYRLTALAYARALCMATMGRYEDALREINLLKHFLEQSFSGHGPRETSFIFSLANQLKEFESRFIAASLYRQTKLSKTADEFFIYHNRLARTRQIPDFRMLLAEKVRWLLANDLFHNMEHVTLRDVDVSALGRSVYNLPGKTKISTATAGPSFQRLRELAGLYLRGLEVYESVELIDVPIYWEAKERLEEFSSRRNVVFGRDGRYLYTALKALDFGLNNNELAYVVVTAPMKSKSGFSGELRGMILKSLNQKGVTLDFSFIDTGYEGSIPEFVINLLTDAGGVTLSAVEMDKKIKLLESHKYSRRELVRRGRPSSVDTIEERPKDIESPRDLMIDRYGVVRPCVSAAAISDQLLAWVVEHAIFRNFAPKLDPEKRIRYTKENPLKGYKFFTEFYSDNISTHPKELWIDDKGHKILLKGGPSHTVQADFVSYKFLEAIGVGIPHGVELVYIDGETKLKMEFLENHESLGIQLPSSHQNSLQIQRAILVDALLGNYDRTPWNILHKVKVGAEERDTVFVDNGASLFSRARGGHKGFPDYFDIEQLKEILSNPQFIGQPVNAAYDNLLQVKDGKVVVKGDDPLRKEFLRVILETFEARITDDLIDRAIAQAEFRDGEKSTRELEGRIQRLTNELARQVPSSVDYQKTVGAIETYKKVIGAGGEASYLKSALRKRRDEILVLLEPLTYL